MSLLSHLNARRSRLAVGWFVVTALVLAAAGLGSLWLSQWTSRGSSWFLTGAFAISTALLVVVSWQLHRAEQAALQERQPALHRSLGLSLAAAVLFLAVQGTALAELLDRMDSDRATIGPRAFVFVGVALHALHATAAVFWLVYVTLRGLAGGYDHEYRFGLTTCGWCWHALGVAWLAVLCAFGIAV